MQRLDKYLANLGLASRRETPALCKAGCVLVNGEVVKKSDFKLFGGELLTFQGQEIKVLEKVYAVLYKSAGYISSDEDEFGYPSYKKQMLNCPYVELLHVAGRLDVDTEGLLLLSNDGQFIHQVISPKWEKEKEYEVWLREEISPTDCEQLAKGVQLDDGYLTKPAKVQQLEEKKILLTITEGKYHQVKRMLQAVGNEVVYLKRLRIGDWTLEGLEKGQWKLIENE
ncbi:MAG: rRNA pseudouridine synthase [candidate division SR1 bacterium]|nr:MAG: rRNA pseudouridine synthase [candidate division SR1 bacterium]